MKLGHFGICPAPCRVRTTFALSWRCRAIRGMGRGRRSPRSLTPHLEMDAGLVHPLSPADGPSFGQLPRAGLRIDGNPGGRTASEVSPSPLPGQDGRAPPAAGAALGLSHC